MHSKCTQHSVYFSCFNSCSFVFMDCYCFSFMRFSCVNVEDFSIVVCFLIDLWEYIRLLLTLCIVNQLCVYFLMFYRPLQSEVPTGLLSKDLGHFSLTLILTIYFPYLSNYHSPSPFLVFRVTTVQEAFFAVHHMLSYTNVDLTSMLSVLSQLLYCRSLSLCITLLFRRTLILFF